MPLFDGVAQAAAADTLKALETAGQFYVWLDVQLDDDASGPAIVGGAAISIASNIGVQINPGETRRLEGGNTSATFFVCSGNAAGKDIIRFSGMCP